MTAPGIFFEPVKKVRQLPVNMGGARHREQEKNGLAANPLFPSGSNQCAAERNGRGNLRQSCFLSVGFICVNAKRWASISAKVATICPIARCACDTCAFPP